MDVTPLIDSDQQVIQSYSSGQFRVSGKIYKQSILVAPHHCADWQRDGVLSLDDFQPLIDVRDSIDVVLVGTGAKTVFLTPDVKRALREAGLHVECMDTGAACRTYNVLMAEARRVVAALMPL